MGALEDQIGRIVSDAVDEALAPYVRRLTDPECLTYSIPQASKVLGVSEHMVRRAVDDGHLPLVPHMGERRLIPRRAVEALVHGAAPLHLVEAPTPGRIDEAPAGAPPAAGRGHHRTA